MAKLLYKLKNDALFLALFVVIFAVILFDLFMISFDIIQFVKISQNSANLFNSFISLNIFAGVFNCVAIVVIILYFVLDSRRIKINNKTAKKWY